MSILLSSLALASRPNCPSPSNVQMVFSSSCTVYGMPDKSPITESTPLGAISPYGRTKLFQEDMFRDLAASDTEWHILLLRWGAEAGRQGEVQNTVTPWPASTAFQLLTVCGVIQVDSTAVHLATIDGVGLRGKATRVKASKGITPYDKDRGILPLVWAEGQSGEWGQSA